jgi:signal transduction histidine kinase
MTAGSNPATRSYWRFQALFWGGYWVLQMTFARIWGYSSGVYDLMFAGQCGLMLGITHGYRLLYLRYGISLGTRAVWLHLLWLLPVSAVLVQLVFAACTRLFLLGALRTTPGANASLGASGPMVGYLISTAFILLVWCLVCLLRAEWRRRRDAERDYWQNQLRLREVELQFLRSQINSHFLFNALNNIRSLVREDADAARQGLSDLATLLRGLMHGKVVTVVRLDEEIELVKGYLALEALQFEQRLAFELQVDPDLLGAKLPPLLLQTLVENAVKHGIARRAEGGTVRISARCLPAGRWQLQVENPAAELPSRHEGNGIGLRNAHDRLKAAFGDLARLDLTMGPTVRATAELPL